MVRRIVLAQRRTRLIASCPVEGKSCDKFTTARDQARNSLRRVLIALIERDKNNQQGRRRGEHMHRAVRRMGPGAAAAISVAAAFMAFPASAAWEPTRPVEFVVPAGTGGGADQMARTIQGIITKHG